MMGRPVKHVEVYEGRDGQWRFRLVYANGEKGTASQGYAGDRSHSRYGAKRGAQAAHPGVPVQAAA